MAKVGRVGWSRPVEVYFEDNKGGRSLHLRRLKGRLEEHVARTLQLVPMLGAQVEDQPELLALPLLLLSHRLGALVHLLDQLCHRCAHLALAPIWMEERVLERLSRTQTLARHYVFSCPFRISRQAASCRHRSQRMRLRGKLVEAIAPRYCCTEWEVFIGQ